MKFTNNENLADLGEGLFVNEKDLIISWVDIDNQKIFLLKEDLDIVTQFDYPFIPSNIFYCDKVKAIILDNCGVREFFWDDCSFNILFQFPSNFLDNSFRTNDGVMLSRTSFLFGIMHKTSPDKNLGKVWLLEQGTLKEIQKNYIPNSFIVINDIVLITDSYKKIIYKYSIKERQILGIWKDMSMFEGNPDGGFYNNLDFCFISIWGQSTILKLDLDGNIKSSKKLPVKFPTNCKRFKQKIAITSARIQKKENIEINDLNGSLLIEDLF